jgi:hypothetical protein
VDASDDFEVAFGETLAEFIEAAAAEVGAHRTNLR